MVGTIPLFERVNSVRRKLMARYAGFAGVWRAELEVDSGMHACGTRRGDDDPLRVPL